MTELEQYVAAAVGACDELIAVIEKKKEALRKEDLHETFRLAGIVAGVSRNHERVDQQMYELIHGHPDFNGGDEHESEERGG